ACARPGPGYWITISSKVRRMSSIIACSSPGTSAASGTRCGVLTRPLTPSACASRLAGSIVKTQTLRPYSAARSAIAAAVVVLPTPPAPQHTTTRLDVSRRIDARSSTGGVVLIDLLLWSDSLRSPDALIVERFCKLVEAAEIDPVGDGGQLQPRHLDLV